MGITKRSVAIGLVLAAAHTCWIVRDGLLAASSAVDAASTLFPSVLALLFALLLVNTILRRRMPARALQGGELAVIFCMLTAATAISSVDLMGGLFTTLMWPYHPKATLSDYTPLLARAPAHLAPHDEGIIRGFFLGSTDAWRFFRPNVLRAWAVPLLFWAIFLLALAGTTYCISAVLRRQWLDREKLPFPVLDLPIAMVRAGDAAALLGNRLFLAGAGAVSLLLVVNYLSCLYPSVPGVRLNIVNIGALVFRSPPYSGMNPVFISWGPAAVGLCYLMPLDVSFSCWLFHLLIKGLQVYGTAMGWRQPDAGYISTEFPYNHHMAEGAWIGMFLLVMWGSRKHVAQVLRVAARKEAIPEEDREPMTYRAAVCGAAAGMVLLVAMATASGMRLHVALLFVAIYFLAVTVMTRIYAQIAVPSLEVSYYSTVELTANLVGTGTMAAREATMLTYFGWADWTYRPHYMAHHLESMVLARRHGAGPRAMTRAVLLALLVGIVVGIPSYLQLYYSRGAATGALNDSAFGVGWVTWTRRVAWASERDPGRVLALAKILSATAVVLLLAVARNVWFGFPLHPVGFAFACSWTTEYIWNVILLTWLVKLLVLRWGGLPLYRRSLPLFYGMVLGDAVTRTVLELVSSALHIQNAHPYLSAMP